MRGGADGTSLEVCGNGIVDVAPGEPCDHLGGMASATCHANCTASRCGDGIANIASGEQRDTAAGRRSHAM